MKFFLISQFIQIFVEYRWANSNYENIRRGPTTWAISTQGGRIHSSCFHYKVGHFSTKYIYFEIIINSSIITCKTYVFDNKFFHVLTHIHHYSSLPSNNLNESFFCQNLNDLSMKLKTLIKSSTLYPFWMYKRRIFHCMGNWVSMKSLRERHVGYLQGSYRVPPPNKCMKIHLTFIGPRGLDRWPIINECFWTIDWH